MFSTARALAALVVLTAFAATRVAAQGPAQFGTPYVSGPGTPSFTPASAPAMLSPATGIPSNSGPPASAPNTGSIPSYSMQAANSWLPLQPKEPCNALEDRNSSLLNGNPYLDDKCSSPVGWFAALEADFVDTHIKNRLISSVTTTAGVTDNVHLPTAPLDWTVSPRIELGYRFGQSAGDFVLSYRFLNTSGNDAVPNFDAAGNAAALHSRLSINVWDFDYGNWEDSLLPFAELRWRVGLRVASNFFDSQANSPLLEERTSNWFVGAGPHAAMDIRHCISNLGIAILGRVEGAVLMGTSHDNYEQIFLGGPGGPDGGATSNGQYQTVPVLSAQAGVEWSPPTLQQLRVSAGYQYERWWDYAGPQGHFSDMFSQGVFFRVEYRY